MIKTVSFAPPRTAKTRSSSAPTQAPKAGKRAASGSPAQQSLDFLTEAGPVDVSEKKAEAKKELTKIKDPKLSQAKPKEPKAETTRVVTTKAEASKPKVARTKAANSKSAATQEMETPAAVTAPIPAPVEAAKSKARKPRVPADLAAQYGEKPTSRIEAPTLEEKAAKKRLSKAEREARRELIKPDEGLLARLARTTQIVIKKPKAEPRGKGWKFECGRCGQTSFFQTPGGVCPCGTIAVKELV